MTNSRKTWIPVYEKAYAKLAGSYSSLVGGWPEKAISTITGSPGFQWSVASFTAQSLFTKVDAVDLTDYLVAVTKITAPYGLVSNHAYLIESTFTVKLTNATTVLLYKIYNPFASDANYTFKFAD